MRRLVDVAWATALLGQARLRTRRGNVGRLSADGDPKAPWPPLSEAQRRVIDRTIWAVAVAARYVPWRSDCMVQAIAARALLDAHRIESRLVIGVPSKKGADFEAHAWLISHGVTVTGGNVDRFTAFPNA